MANASELAALTESVWVSHSPTETAVAKHGGFKSILTTILSQLGALDKSRVLDKCRLFSSALRVLRANTRLYLTEKRVKQAETGGA